MRSIGDRSFDSNISLHSLILPENLEHIGSWTFEGCLNLIRVDLPSSLTSLGNGTFASCINLQVVMMPEGLRYIGRLAFYRCGSLRSIRLPKGVIIDPEAFDWNDGLQEIYVLRGFEGFEGRTDLPEHIQVIEFKKLFPFCLNIEKPSFVKEIVSYFY